MSESWREVSLEWKGEHAFLGNSANGGVIQIGTTEEKPGPSPMELMLMGIGGCTGIDIVDIMTKARQRPEKLEVRVRGKRAPEGTYPRVYTDIVVTYLVWGSNIDTRLLESAIDLSQAKYCSASGMVKGVAKITTEYVVLQPGEPEPNFA